MDRHPFLQNSNRAVLPAFAVSRLCFFARFRLSARRGCRAESPQCRNCIFYTACSIRRKPRALGRIKAGDGLDQSDGADGDQVLLLPALGIVFFDDVRNQSEVAFNKRVPGFQVAFRITLQILPLLRRIHGLWKGSPAGQAQGKQQAVGK
jgi:hypothetical protein